MKITNKILTLMVAASALLMVSCDDDEDDDAASTATLNVTLNGLDDLTGTPYVYEGWLLIDGSPVSTGQFTTADQASASFDATQAASATKYILTVEPAVGDVPEPSELKVMAGDISNGSADITLDVAPALGEGVDFSGASGYYLVAAPTAAGMAGFENSGVWFLDNRSGSMEEGLNLPALGSDYVYEGWVVTDAGPISTGTFTSLSGADNESPFSNGGPDFPGEDFVTDAPTGVTFPLDVTQLNVVISVEPANDLDPAPFFIKPLVRGSNASGTLSLNTLPTGTITIQ